MNARIPSRVLNEAPIARGEIDTIEPNFNYASPLLLLFGKAALIWVGHKLRERLSTASMYLLDMVKDYITRTRASIKGAVPKARDTAAGALVV
jgi:hypothetical protein